MADNKIVHRVSLEGADKVFKQLESIGDVGDKAFKRVKSAADNASSIGKSGEGFGGLGKTEESRAAAERLREVLHTLHPVLDSAGLGLGNLGAFARVAGAGFGAFAAAVVGAAVVGLAKLSDQAAATKKQLDDLTGGKGGAHLAGLREDAKRLGTDVDNLIPAYKQSLGLRDDLNAGNRSVIYAPGHEPFNLPGGALSNENLRAATGSVQSLFAAGKAADPAKAAEDFFTAVRKAGGKLSPEALQGAAAASPGAANKIAQSLPEGFGSYQQAIAALQSGRVIDKEELYPSLAKAAPEAEKAARAVRGLKESIDGLEGSLKESAAGGTGGFGHAVAGAIDALSSGIAATGADLNAPSDQKNDLGKNLPTIPPATLPGFLKNALVNPGAIPGNTDQSLPPLVGFKPQQPTASGPFEYIPPPKEDFQYIPPPEKTNGPRSDAGDLAAPQQLASLGSAFEDFIAMVAAAVSKGSAGLDQSGQPAAAAGVRGASGGLLHLAEGGGIGHVRGPGTSTSDSIPAMLSDGEYVVKADKVRKYGVPLMDAINKGIAHFAAGGAAATGGATKFSDLSGNVSVTYDPDTGGAYINGNLFPPGSPILDDPQIKQLIEQSKAGMKESSGPKHKSQFTTGERGNYAKGGLVGSAPSREDIFRSRLASMLPGGGIVDPSSYRSESVEL